MTKQHRSRIGAKVAAVAVLGLTAMLAGASGSDARSAALATTSRSRALGATGADVNLSGTVAGTGTLGGTASCGLDLSVANDATITLAAGGEVELQADYCVTTFDPSMTAAPIFGGTFTITTSGGTVTGTVTGSTESANATPRGFPVHLVLTATGGTGDLIGATGTVTFDGFSSAAASTIVGSTSGTVTPGADPTTSSTAPVPTSAPRRTAPDAAAGPAPAAPAPVVSGQVAFTG